MSQESIQFSNEELNRYNRQIILPEFGLDGQKKIKVSKVLVIGAGGLGSPLLLYLAAAGIGTIGILDEDTIHQSNLQRQVLFGSAEVGLGKVEIAKAKLTALNPEITFITYNIHLDHTNALQILKDYDYAHFTVE